jgi:formylglycine-generating enzyme required for sulfatase activity
MESGNNVFTEPQIGDVIEGYEVLKPLGAGGMGRVYQVRNTLSNRVDAMKILLPDLASDPDLTARFLSEIQVLGALSHPNIAALYTAFRVGDRFAMILEFVEGEALNARLKAGRMSPEEAVACICPVLEAVGYAHGKGVVHRDIKPGNIILTANGSVKLVDFGIAKTAASPALTAAGAAVGSAYYMSPEQVLGSPFDGRSDLYSVGVTLYEMVTGERPIRGETEYSIMEGHLKHVPEPANKLNPEIPAALSAVIAKALAKDPADRFQTAEAFLDTVREIRGGRPAAVMTSAAVQPKPPATPEIQPVPARHRSLWKVAVFCGIGVAVLAGAGLWFSRGTKAVGPPPPVASPAQTLNLPSGEMTLIPAGQALLGAGRHPVNVGAFYMDLTEVSNAAYAAFCRATGVPVPPGGTGDPDLPVVNVSFTDAQAFARWAGKRLPRPEEWEKAARGAQGQLLPWGDALDASHANVGGAGAPSGLQPVRSHLDGKSPYGVLNLIGNVWEWVDAPVSPGKAQMKNLAGESWARALDPPLSLTESYMQIRGGSYSFLSGARVEDLPQVVYDYAILPVRIGRPEVGFRCVKDVAIP